MARALVNAPLLVLADEPTGNLDRENASAVIDLLAASTTTGEEGGRRTVIVATHDPFVVGRCDEVVTL